MQKKKKKVDVAETPHPLPQCHHREHDNALPNYAIDEILDDKAMKWVDVVRKLRPKLSCPSWHLTSIRILPLPSSHISI